MVIYERESKLIYYAYSDIYKSRCTVGKNPPPKTALEKELMKKLCLDGLEVRRGNSLIVNSDILVEVDAATHLTDKTKKKFAERFRASSYALGLLVNFGKWKTETHRVIKK